MLGIDPTPATARARGVPIEGWMDIEAGPDPAAQQWQGVLPAQQGPQPPAYQTGVTWLREFDIDTMDGFNTRHRTYDKLSGHEMLQFAWLKAHGYATRRAEGLAAANPAIALGDTIHKAVNKEQRDLGLHDTARLRQMTAQQNIDLNETAMENAGIPSHLIEIMKREAVRYAATLPPP